MPGAERVLVLDGETRASLAVVRSLGAQGLQPAVASHLPKALSFASRHCGMTFVCPDPSYAPDMYVKWLLELVDQWQPSLVLPNTDLSLKLALRVEPELRAATILPTVDSETFETVTDKAALIEIAGSLGVRVPRTLSVPEGSVRGSAVEEEVRRFSYPAVAKLTSSYSDLRSHFVKADTYYVDSAADALRLMSGGSTPLSRLPFLLQERVYGKGVGVFALCLDGEPLVLFSHQRLLEKPPSGGRSVLSESLPLEYAPVEPAVRLLRHFRWNGVAMVEFKQAEDGTAVLMEINPRFWGSLQLAVDSGCDFPALLYRLYADGIPPSNAAVAAVTQTMGYRSGQRLRWVLGSLDHFLIRLKARPLATLRGVFKQNELRLFEASHSTRCEVCRMEDIRPFFRELWQYMLALLLRDSPE